MAAVVVVGAVTCGDVAAGQADDKLGNKQKFSESPNKERGSTSRPGRVVGPGDYHKVPLPAMKKKKLTKARSRSLDIFV
jgi:hypothetical protein